MTTRRTILQEINSYIPTKNKEELIESKASHIIVSAINLINLIYETYEKEDAELFEKKILSSIRGRDPERFAKTALKLKEKNGDDL